MNKQEELELKIKLLSTKGMLPLLVDYTKVLEKVTLNVDSSEGEDIMYGRLVKAVVDQLKGSYKTQIRVQEQQDKVVVQTRDLENLIADIASGKEPVWKSKLIDNGTE